MAVDETVARNCLSLSAPRSRLAVAKGLAAGDSVPRHVRPNRHMTSLPRCDSRSIPGASAQRQGRKGKCKGVLIQEHWCVLCCSVWKEKNDHDRSQMGTILGEMPPEAAALMNMLDEEGRGMRPGSCGRYVVSEPPVLVRNLGAPYTPRR